MSDQHLTDWDLADFHAGVSSVLAAVYGDHYADVEAAVGRFLHGADAETAIHEVFFKLVNRPEVRRNFRGGSMAAWLRTVAANHARDFLKRRGRELPITPARAVQLAEERRDDPVAELDGWLDRFCRDHLPAKWRPVFEARFLRELSQREAAAELGMSRTTLAYQEGRIRRLLRKYLAREGYR